MPLNTKPKCADITRIVATVLLALTAYLLTVRRNSRGRILIPNNKTSEVVGVMVINKGVEEDKTQIMVAILLVEAATGNLQLLHMEITVSLILWKLMQMHRILTQAYSLVTFLTNKFNNLRAIKRHQTLTRIKEEEVWATNQEAEATIMEDLKLPELKINITKITTTWVECMASKIMVNNVDTLHSPKPTTKLRCVNTLCKDSVPTKASAALLTDKLN